MNLLKVSGIRKQEGGRPVLQGVSFTQSKFQKIAIAGESGSGKSTLLKAIAGLVQPDEGEVLFEQERVRGPYEKLIPGHPGIAYLSQHFELRNNYRVEELLEYANTLPVTDAATLYDVCRIKPFLKRRTDQLSGGEKQRIALARLLIGAPRLLLLDEPFSNLDLIHKQILKSVIRDIGERLDITCLLVSHDPVDTLSWADELLVMRQGQILQQGAPQHVYRQPVDEYTAGLLGNYNLISPAQSKAFLVLPGFKARKGDIMVRPEDFKLVSKRSTAIKGKVNKVNYFGSYSEIEVLLTEGMITVRTGAPAPAEGKTVYVSLSLSDILHTNNL